MFFLSVAPLARYLVQISHHQCHCFLALSQARWLPSQLKSIFCCTRAFFFSIHNIPINKITLFIFSPCVKIYITAVYGRHLVAVAGQWLLQIISCQTIGTGMHTTCLYRRDVPCAAYPGVKMHFNIRSMCLSSWLYNNFYQNVQFT